VGGTGGTDNRVTVSKEFFEMPVRGTCKIGTHCMSPAFARTCKGLPGHGVSPRPSRTRRSCAAWPWSPADMVLSPPPPCTPATHSHLGPKRRGSRFSIQIFMRCSAKRVDGAWCVVPRSPSKATATHHPRISIPHPSRLAAHSGGPSAVGLLSQPPPPPRTLSVCIL
jgi:hypothetical protein